MFMNLQEEKDSGTAVTAKENDWRKEDSTNKASCKTKRKGYPCRS